MRSRIARFLGVTLRVRPGELSHVVLLFSWLFCLVGAIWLSRTVRDSLFLANLSAAELPKMYIASPLVVAAVGFLYARLADHARRGRVVIGTALASGVVLCAARLAVGRGPWLYYALYGAVDVAASLVAVQFWTVAGERFTARDAKRLIGLIAAGGTLANIVIGFGISGVVKRAGAENLLFVCAALFFLCGGFAAALARLHGGHLGRGRPRGTIRGRDPRGLDAPGARHLRIVVVIVVAAVLTWTSLDFVFKASAAQALGGDRVAMVRFFGILAGTTGCAALLIQLGVTARLLARIGVVDVLLFLPLCMALGAVALLLLPGLAAATLAKGSEGTLRYTLNDAGMQLVYLPVPALVRSRVKATIDAVVRPGTEALVGVGLWVARAFAVALAPIAAAALVTATIWTVAVIRLRGAYVRSLRETLRRQRVNFDAGTTSAAGLAIEALAPVVAAATPERLLDELGGGRRVVEALAQLGAGLEPQLAAAIDDAAGAAPRRRDAARALGRLATAEAAQALAARLDIDGEGLRGEVCRALAAAHRRNPALWVANGAIRGAIDRELERAYHALAAAEGLGRPETAINPDGTRAAPPFLPGAPDGAAALISKALGERWERATARVIHLLAVLHPDANLVEVQRNLADADPARRANAVEVLDMTLERGLRRKLVPLVDDTPRFLKLQAVEGVLPLPRRTRDGWVRELLADPSPWMAACAAYYASMHDLVVFAAEVERLRAHEDPVTREAAGAAARRLAAC